MKIDIHNNKRETPLDEVVFGSVVFIENIYYLVFDNYGNDNEGMMTLINLETGKKKEFEENLKVEVLNARLVID